MDLLIMNSDGSDVACIACGGALDPIRTAPSWSPDGKAIAYATDYPDASPVALSGIDVILDEGRALNLVLGSDGFEDPSWSPDGQWIVFTYTRRLDQDPSSNLWEWADPQICVVPFRSTATPIPIAQIRCLTSEGWNVHPHWSPDGSWIAFTHAVSDEPGATSDIFRMRPDGTEKTNLTNTPETGEGNPRWAPNGKKIAYGRWDPNQRQTDVWVMDADGSNQVNLTPGPEDGLFPAWSPDGKKIVFVTTRTSQPDQPWCEGGCLGYNEVYIMNADGSDPVNITSNPQVYSEQPDWRPRSGNPSVMPSVAAAAGIIVIAGSVWAVRRWRRARQVSR
jgi:Tol biopolymer transport system component